MLVRPITITWFLIYVIHLFNYGTRNRSGAVHVLSLRTLKSQAIDSPSAYYILNLLSQMLSILQGFIPSATSMVLCWGFLLIEALLLTEINVNIRRRMKKREDEDKLEIISIRTMAQETLGTWGGNLATINYIFLAYTSMVAYTSKAGEILSRVINLPASLSGILFTIIFTTLISFGGPRFTDQINQWLTASMIGKAFISLIY